MTRRGLLRSAGITWAGGSAVFLAACGSGEGEEDEADEGARPNDADLLNGALDLEHLAVAAYTAGAGRLDGDVLQTVGRHLDHEREHVAALSAAIREMGGTPNRARAAYELPALRSQRDVLRFAANIEETAISAYLDVLPRLGTGPLRATASSIVAAEAEHLTVLRLALGEEAVPDAFVTGRRAAA